MIEVQQLTKRYGPFTAVDGVSFNVGKGEILGFLGPNGAGKTTTMRILTGYMPPTEGRARVAGFDLQEQPVRSQAAHRLPAGDAAALPRHDGARVPPLRGPHQGRARRRAGRAGCGGDAAHARRRHGQPPLRQAVEGLQAARRPRSGADPQPRRARPRRADRRPRSEADHRNPRTHPQPGRATTRSC